MKLDIYLILITCSFIANLLSLIKVKGIAIYFSKQLKNHSSKKIFKKGDLKKIYYILFSTYILFLVTSSFSIFVCLNVDFFQTVELLPLKWMIKLLMSVSLNSLVLITILYPLIYFFNKIIIGNIALGLFLWFIFMKISFALDKLIPLS